MSSDADDDDALPEDDWDDLDDLACSGTLNKAMSSGSGSPYIYYNGE